MWHKLQNWSFADTKLFNVLAGDVSGIEEIGGGEDGLPVGGLVVVQGRPWIVEALFALRSKINYILPGL